MADQSNVPAYPDDHDCFKQMAAKRKVSMKDLFHEWVVNEMYRKNLQELFEGDNKYD